MMTTRNAVYVRSSIPKYPNQRDKKKLTESPETEDLKCRLYCWGAAGGEK